VDTRTLLIEEIWRGIHRFGGYMFVIAGILMILAAFLPAPLNIILTLTGVVLAAVFSTVYSYFLFVKVKRKQH
jgi:uncharacterized membrane protein